MRRLEEIKRDAEDDLPAPSAFDRLDLVALVERLRDALEPFANMRPTWRPGEQTQLILMDRTELDDARAALAAADGADTQTARDDGQGGT